MGEADAKVAHHDFVRAVAGALRHRCRVRQGDRLVIAVSGGADSVALLRALAGIAPRRGWELSLAVGHVQHGLHEQAQEHAQFVAALAESLDLPFLRADLTPPAKPDNIEAWARWERYAALAEMARAFDAAAVVTAHHADDQLETLLMRLLRGASVQGLAGIAWRRRLSGERGAALLRPMLAVDRPAVVRFLRDIAQPHRQDPTNQDVRRVRNRLRRDVLPVLRDLRPDAPARAVALAAHLRQVARLLEKATAAAADRATVEKGQTVLDRVESRLLPPVVLTALLRRLLLEAGAAKDQLGTRALAPLVRAVRDRAGGRREFAPAGVPVSVSRDRIVVG